MQITVERYTPEMAPIWDATVDASRNGTFILRRGYMDYHADRFPDCSLIFRNRRGDIVAMLAACRGEDTLLSHAGLTYGGLILPYRHASAQDILDVFDALKAWCRDEGIKKIVYKAIPHIYHRYPAEEDLYALFRNGARISSTLIAGVTDMHHPLGPDMSYRRSIRQAAADGVKIARSDDFASFWGILEDRLKERFDAIPVHTLEEIKLLAGRFPDHIRLYLAHSTDGELLAGTVIYVTDRCVHSQYTATTARGRLMRVLPALLQHTIDETRSTCRYYDFGTSNEDRGRVLNTGLAEQKQCMGGRGVAYLTFELDID